MWVLSANVRGLNGTGRRDAVRDLASDASATIVCLQETKLQNVDRSVVVDTLGLAFADNFVSLPADGTKGGIILAASSDFFSLTPAGATTNTISATITDREDGSTWGITGVYGPQGDADKYAFIEELHGLTTSRPARWLILGDFNLIYRAGDKNNGRLNRRLMGKFKSALDALRLRELRLTGKKFTWSNEQATPTMTRIDRFFCSDGWDTSFPSAILQPLPSVLSDHSPLLLIGEATFPKARCFRFEAFWTRMEGFQEVVTAAWVKPVHSLSAVRRLHIKLARVAKALKAWHKKRFGDLRMQSAIAKEVIARLDCAQEQRPLSTAERKMRVNLRARIQGIATIIKIRIRQRARLANIRLGDANSKIFHLHANGRRRKNFIVNLRTAQGLAVTHEEKQEVLRTHFLGCLGTAESRKATFNWEELGNHARDLSHLETPFLLE